MSEALRLLEGVEGVEGVDITMPSPARIYDCLLRGANHFDADAVAARRIVALVPEAADTAWASRGYHQRAASWIARQGVRQFLDIGSGLPAVGNTREVVRRIRPDARVVYVDNDPLVELHRLAFLGSGPRSGAGSGPRSGGAVGVIRADLRDPDSILENRQLRALIDPREPTGLLMNAVMMFVADESDPRGLVSRYVRALAPGSYLSLSHATGDAKPPAAVEGVRQLFDNATEHLYLRSRAEVARFFDGLELIPPHPGARPGLAHTGVWGAEDPELADSDGSRWVYCGVARIA